MFIRIVKSALSVTIFSSVCLAVACLAQPVEAVDMVDVPACMTDDGGISAAIVLQTDDASVARVTECAGEWAQIMQELGYTTDANLIYDGMLVLAAEAVFEDSVGTATKFPYFLAHMLHGAFRVSE